MCNHSDLFSFLSTFSFFFFFLSPSIRFFFPSVLVVLLSGASSFHMDYFQFHLASPRVVPECQVKIRRSR